MVEGVRDRWGQGDRYEPYVGRWSRLVAREFLAALRAPPRLDWLDVGCGTGALVATIKETCAPQRICGVDPSPGFLEFAQGRVREAEFKQGNAQELPFANAEFDRVVSALVMNFVPDQPRAAAQMARITRPGGEIALYVWDYGRMELMRRFWDTAVSLDSHADALDETKRFPICQPDALRRLFETAGLSRVETWAIDIPTVFRNFEDYWSPFLGGQGPAPSYCVSLSEDARAALREKLHSLLPTERDGSIHLSARALAVRGRRA